MADEIDLHPSGFFDDGLLSHHVENETSSQLRLEVVMTDLASKLEVAENK